MPFAAKLFSIAVILALAGGSVPAGRPLLASLRPAEAVRAVRTGRGRACPPLPQQELPGWLKRLAIAALLVALSVFSLAAALL